MMTGSKPPFYILVLPDIECRFTGALKRERENEEKGAKEVSYRV